MFDAATENNSSVKAIEIFPWNDNFNTGIDKIDEQHRRLAQLLNMLASHIAFQSDIPALNTIFDELADYAVYHFETEEGIWHEYLAEDPLESAHKQVHSSFITHVLKLKSECGTKPADQVIEDVLAFLTRWLAAHILETDRYMALVVLAIQSGMPLESAKRQAGDQMRGATRALIDIILSIYESLTANTLHLMRDIAVRHRTDEVLRISEERLRLALGAANQGWFDLNVQTDEISVSPEYVRMIGFEPENFHSSFDEWKKSLHPDDRENLLKSFNECLETGGPMTLEYRRSNRNGEWQWISSVGKVVEWDQNHNPLRMIGIHTDISAHKQAQRRIERLTQLYATLSSINEAIVHLDANAAEPVTQLYRDVCRIAVEKGGIQLAWIGHLNPQNGLIEPLVWYGENAEYLQGLVISANADRPEGCGPTGTAFRENHTFFVDDFSVNPATQVWKLRASPFSWGSSAALPIRCADKPCAVMTLYQSAITVWDEDARMLVNEIARELSFALDLLKIKAQKEQSEIAIRESEAFLRESQRIAGLGSYVLDIGAGLWKSSAVLDQLFGIDESYERTVEGWESLIHPDDRAMMDNYFKDEVLGQGKEFKKEYRIIRQLDKSVRRMYGLGKLEFNDQGVPLRMVGTIQDVTEMKQIEDTMRKLSLAVEQSPNSIVITDLKANIEYVNATFTRVTGYTLNEVQGLNPHILQSGKTPKAVYDDMWAHLTRGDSWQGEFVNRRKDGSEYSESVMITPVKQEGGQITNYLAVKQDITEKKLIEARIEQLAHFDQLTGLPNREQMNVRFKYALNLAQRSGEALSVLFLDLDRFKNINDTLGHTTGDRLLIEMANRIRHVLREEDTVSRLGGDEFILILPNTDETGVAHVANKLLEAIARPCQIGQHELVTTVSIGIAIFPADGCDFETLMKNADAAMYRVKQDKRNAYRFFTQEMQAHSARIMQLSNAMRHALARNEFQLYYQPQISIEGHIVGAEALLRWQHPELGMISPAEFIPIAEDSGQIIQIGEWVLRTATRQLKDWMAGGLPAMVMAVNLSSVQFRQPNITSVITGVLDEVGLPHEYLELELTEAMAMDDPRSAIEVMDKLHETGVRMSIDDFGTGYSSLSYLKKFKVYKLKIDQSFVRDITVDPDDKAIVTAIIHMASSLGIRTIAEGVETAGQLAFLRLQGCDEVQGFYFSRPLIAAQFESYVRAAV